MAEALSNWGDTIQLKIVKNNVVDFQVQEQGLDVIEFEAVLQPMPAQKVDRKPEDLRNWKWWTMYTEQRLDADDVVQDADGLQFKIQSREDWRKAGFFKYELAEQPK